MAVIEKRIEEMGITLPDSPQPIANYVPAVQTGNLLFVAGLGPAEREDGSTPNGKVGRDLTLEEGYEAARLVGINLLARLKSTLGDLGQGRARREATIDGELRAGVHAAASSSQRLFGPVGGGVRRQGTARALGGRDGIASERHPGRNRDGCGDTRLMLTAHPWRIREYKNAAASVPPRASW